MKKLYHASIGFPKALRIPTLLRGLVYGYHAKTEALKDRYGKILDLPKDFDAREAKIFEIETINGVITKIAFRQTLDEAKDICVVFIPQTMQVKTVWINLKSDKHFTLDKTKYDKP